MVIIDFNQVTIANITMSLTFNGGVLDENMIRHMILNSIRMYRTKFKDKYGELVICSDDTQYWRKDNFPYYKQNRKETQKKSTIDWNELFRILNKIRDELDEFFPYRLIRVRHAEADDLIGTLCHKFGRDLGGEPILIVSGDKDFKQLQQYSNVQQWGPTTKRFITENDPIGYIKEHIIRGDSSDGIPNFLSDDDTFMTPGKRQKSINKNKLKGWMTQEPEEFCSTEKLLRNWKRNQELIDLSFVPDSISEECMKQYDEQEGKTRKHLLNYFIKNRLKNLMSQMGEF